MTKEQKRTKIRDAAARIFAERGFENTTTRDIAKFAEISPASVYYYFDSKEVLLYQILDETMSTGLALIEEIEQSDKSLKEKLSDILRIHTKAAVDYKKMKLLVHDQKSLTPDHQNIIRQKQRSYVRKLIDILEDLKQKGEIQDLDATVCAFAFFGMVSWAYRWYNPKGRITPDELAEIFDRIFTKGIYLNHPKP